MEDGQKRSILSIVISTRDRSDFFDPRRPFSISKLDVTRPSLSTYKMDHIRIRSKRTPCGIVFFFFKASKSYVIFLVQSTAYLTHFFSPPFNISSLSDRHAQQTQSAY